MEARDLDELIAGWDGLGVMVRRDQPTGSWIFIALHDDTLGTPTGGTRMRVYPSPAAGLADAMRLAAGMTRKWAGIDFPFGGGKAVLAVPRPMAGAERKGLLQRYGRVMRALHGGFGTGPDLGISAEDMLVVAREAPYVHGVDPEAGTSEDAGPYTARGVLAAIRVALGHTTGSAELAGRTVLVQGLGAVGEPLSRHLAGAGARLKLSDVDGGRSAALAAELEGEVVAPEAVAEVDCDVYAPCAIGGVLNAQTIPRLACRIVAGSANNQLEEEADAARLAERSILYAPDFIANAGGAIAFALMGRGTTAAEIGRRIDGIGETLEGIFNEAEKRGESPLAAAERRVREVLERHRRA